MIDTDAVNEVVRDRVRTALYSGTYRETVRGAYDPVREGVQEDVEEALFQAVEEGVLQCRESKAMSNSGLRASWTMRPTTL